MNSRLIGVLGRQVALVGKMSINWPQLNTAANPGSRKCFNWLGVEPPTSPATTS